MEHAGPSRRKKKSKCPIEPTDGPSYEPEFDESGNPIPLKPCRFPYPFHKKFSMTNEMKEVEARIKDYPVLNPIYPDLSILDAHNLLEPLKNCFQKVGCDFMFYVHPGVYESMVRESVYSFVPSHRRVKAKDSEFGIVEKHVEGWKFQLRGRSYYLPREDLRTAFGIAYELVKFPHCTDDTWGTLWRDITGIDEEFKPSE